MANTCTKVSADVSRDVFAYFCDQNLGAVRSLTGTSGVTLADISSISDTRQNQVASQDIASATVEIMGLPNEITVDGEDELPAAGTRGLLELTQGNVDHPNYGVNYFSEFVIIESVEVSASVGEALIFRINFSTAVAPETT
jgi:hypothetical protein